METIDNLINRINTESYYTKVSCNNNRVSVKSGDAEKSFKECKSEEEVIEYLDNYLKALFHIKKYEELCNLLCYFSTNFTGNEFFVKFSKDFKELFENINLYVPNYPINKSFFKEDKSDIAFEHAGNIIHITFE